MDDQTDKPIAGQVRQSSVGWMLKRLSGSLDRQMQARLKALDLNLGAFMVLMTLLEEEGLSQSEIGRKVDMRGYATTRVLDALEGQKLVERRSDSRSRRAYRIHLTDRGRALSPQLFALVREINAGLMAPLTVQEREVFPALLHKALSARLEDE
jgi:DNA-binding MarR family transcriptional regulator